MKRTRQILLSSITVGGLVFAGAGQAFAASETSRSIDWKDAAYRSGAIATDLIFLRPVGAIRSLVGALAYGPSVALIAPYAGITGSWGDVDSLTELFIHEPTDYLFRRPLGERLDGS